MSKRGDLKVLGGRRLIRKKVTGPSTDLFRSDGLIYFVTHGCLQYISSWPGRL